ncbi:MAG: hypothetical protein ACRD43_02070, partial [Pyrinomonadaceae bacterium]
MFELFRKIEDDFLLLDRKALFALIYAAVGLASIFYLKNPEYLAAWTRETRFAGIGDWVAHSSENNLPALAWWVLVVTIFYFVIPALVVKFWQRRPLSEIGLNFRIEESFWKLLLQCIAIMLPLVYLMSLTAGFSAKYPFLHMYNEVPYLSSTLLLWEAIYFVQFFGLEFFFRGFLLHSLK